MSIHSGRPGTARSARSTVATVAGARRASGAARKTTTVTSPSRATLDDTVYGSIKQMILTNQFRPGYKLTHQHIADLLNVSRTPVRQALERLYQESYVIRIPARGFFVAEIDSHEARDLYDVRMALETFALRLAMSREAIGDKQFKHLLELQKVYAKHVTENVLL